MSELVTITTPGSDTPQVSYITCTMNSRAKKVKREQVADIQGRFKNEGHMCVVCPICDKPVVIKYGTLDHIIPLNQGGHPTAVDNLQITHRRCNNVVKGGAMPGEYGVKEASTDGKHRPGLYAYQVPQVREGNLLGDASSPRVLS